MGAGAATVGAGDPWPCAAGVGQILLRLPPDEIRHAAYSELARRHPYDGIVASGAWSDSVADDLRRIFDYHRPGLRCGAERENASANCRDFRLLTIPAASVDAGAIARRVRGQQPVYVLVDQVDQRGQERLPGVLKSLRRSGIRHYGFVHGDYFERPGLFPKLAMEMAQSTTTR